MRLAILRALLGVGHFSKWTLSLFNDSVSSAWLAEHARIREDYDR